MKIRPLARGRNFSKAAFGSTTDSVKLCAVLASELATHQPPSLSTLKMLVLLSVGEGRATPNFRDLTHQTFMDFHSDKRILGAEDVTRIDQLIGWSRTGDIGRKDANFLFRLNDILDKPKAHPSWQALFVTSIGSHVLNDPNSPGLVDFSEAEWLIKNIEGDGSLDVNEKALLDYLDVHSPKGQNLSDLVASVSELLKVQEDSYLKTIRTLIRALETKDRYTAQHSSRVSYFSYKLGKHIGLSEKMQRKLRYGAIMHDLGKIGVPDNILNKPSDLEADEYQIIKRHPVDTVKILKPLADQQDFISIAMSHHERWDGKGYPDGLKGTETPLLSRIVAIADTWDAMVGDRIYRKAIPRDKALGILEREQNMGQWDPELLRSFIDMIRAGDEKLAKDIDAINQGEEPDET